MIRLITAGAFALLLAGCTAEKKEEGGGNNANANEVKVATDATSKFQIGKNI